MAKQPAPKAQADKSDLDLGEQKPGKTKLFIIIGVVVLLLIIGGAAAFFLLSGGDDEDSAEVAPKEEETPQPTLDTNAPPSYHVMKPEFIATLQGGKPNLLQINITLASRDPLLGDFLSHHDPMIRGRILDLLASKLGNELKSRAAKEELQSEILELINSVITKLQGPSKIEQVYFTTFVMQ